jgi:hypothetical protein
VLPNGRRIMNTVQRLMILCGDGIEPTQREIVDAWFAKNHSGNVFTPPTLAPSKRMTEETLLIQKLKNEKTMPNRFGQTGSGFDIVIGNPPSVRADEREEHKRYRQSIREWQFYPLRTRWDVFVPFVYRSLQFLASDGHLALMTSNAIETEGYATDLRTDLMAYDLEQLDFFPGVRLFAGIGMHNTIFFLRKRPQVNAGVRQRIHQDETCTNFTEQTRAQSVGPDALFRCV